MFFSSDAIERLIAARLASKEFGNSPLRSLGSITAQGKFVLTSSSSSTFWQQQKSQQARDLASSKRTAFSTKDLWSATSASMSKALSIFDSSKSKSLGSGASPVNGLVMQSATSALASVSTSNSVNTMAGASMASVGSTASTLGGLAISGKDGFGLYGYDRSIIGNGTAGEGSTYDSTRSPTEAMSTGSMSPVLNSAPARKNRQTFGSPGKAKTAARLEQLRYLVALLELTSNTYTHSLKTCSHVIISSFSATGIDSCPLTRRRWQSRCSLHSTTGNCKDWRVGF